MAMETPALTTTFLEVLRLGLTPSREPLFAMLTDDCNDHHDLAPQRGFTMVAQIWTVAEAKAKFSEVIERAMSEGPQTITRNGRTAGVVVGRREIATQDAPCWQPGGILCCIPPAGIRIEDPAAQG